MTTRIRLPIFALMGLVAVLGLGLGLIRSAPAGWVRPGYSLTVLVLVLTGIAARVRPAPEGHFWFGYALCGAVYLVFNLGGPDSVSAMWLTYHPYGSGLEPIYDTSEGDLIYHTPVTEDWVASFANQVVGPWPVLKAFPDRNRFNRAVILRLKRVRSTLVYSHLMMVHALGLLGGMLALWWTPRRDGATKRGEEAR